MGQRTSALVIVVVIIVVGVGKCAIDDCTAACDGSSENGEAISTWTHQQFGVEHRARSWLPIEHEANCSLELIALRLCDQRLGALQRNLVGDQRAKLFDQLGIGRCLVRWHVAV